MSEKMTALELAILFHVIYERKSSEFNYETRVDTRIFDPESPNGKLMAAVCEEILSEDIQPKIDTLTARIAELESKIARLVEVGDVLTKTWLSVDSEAGYSYCIHCDASDFFLLNGVPITHFPDCPVTLWNKEAHE